MPSSTPSESWISTYETFKEGDRCQDRFRKARSLRRGTILKSPYLRFERPCFRWFVIVAWDDGYLESKLVQDLIKNPQAKRAQDEHPG